MTTGQIITVIGILAPVLGGIYLGRRSGRTSDYTAVATRLANVETRLDETERREQTMTEQYNRAVRYIYSLIAALERAGLDVPEPPERLNGLELPDAQH